MKGPVPNRPCFFIMVFLALLTASHTLYAQDSAFEAGKQAYLDKNYAQAMELLRPLAEAGHAGALVSLGVMYDLGQGVEKNPLEAVKWFEKAALAGNAFVQHDLGVRYFKGDGVAQDPSKAAKWWTMAAESGIAESQYNLGLLCAHGLTLDHNPALAAQWYEKAARQGHAHAQYNLAVLYVNGQGVSRDGAKALALFRQAAESGVPHAQYNLAALLESGDASAEDLDEAHRWYQAAADQGISQAKERLAALSVAARKSPPSTTPTIAKTATAEKANAKTIINRESWILEQPPEHYTVQLAGAGKEDSIRQFFKTHQLGTDAAYFKANLKGKAFYKIIQGVYPDRASALSARAELPEKLMKSGPIIVRFADIQKIISPQPAP